MLPYKDRRKEIETQKEITVNQAIKVIEFVEDALSSMANGAPVLERQAIIKAILCQNKPYIDLLKRFKSEAPISKIQPSNNKTKQGKQKSVTDIKTLYSIITSKNFKMFYEYNRYYDIATNLKSSHEELQAAIKKLDEIKDALKPWYIRFGILIGLLKKSSSAKQAIVKHNALSRQAEADAIDGNATPQPKHLTQETPDSIYDKDAEFLKNIDNFNNEREFIYFCLANKYLNFTPENEEKLHEYLFVINSIREMILNHINDKDLPPISDTYEKQFKKTGGPVRKFIPKFFSLKDNFEHKPFYFIYTHVIDPAPSTNSKASALSCAVPVKAVCVSEVGSWPVKAWTAFFKFPLQERSRASDCNSYPTQLPQLNINK